MEFADDYRQEFFFQDEYDDSWALAMTATGHNIITFKYVIFIFSPLKTKVRAAILYAQAQKNVYF